MLAEKAGDFFHRVVAMDFDEHEIRVARLPLSHGPRLSFIGCRFPRRANSRLRPCVQIGWRVDWRAPGLAEDRAAADDSELGEPFCGAGQAPGVADVLRGLVATEVNRGNCHRGFSKRQKTPAHGGSLADQSLLRTRNWMQQWRLLGFHIAASETREGFFKFLDLFEEIAIRKPATHRAWLNAH